MKGSSSISGPSNQEAETPSWVMLAVEGLYGTPDLDVCATAGNAKAARYISPPHECKSGIDCWAESHDGLVSEWRAARAWCNPPYNNIMPWLNKAAEEVSRRRCARVVMLLPAKTSEAWWHDYVWPHAAEICFVRPRIRFIGAGVSGPSFGSCFVVFGAAGYESVPYVRCTDIRRFRDAPEAS